MLAAAFGAASEEATSESDEGSSDEEAEEEACFVSCGEGDFDANRIPGGVVVRSAMRSGY